jgi:hypothetical protein
MILGFSRVTFGYSQPRETLENRHLGNQVNWEALRHQDCIDHGIDHGSGFPELS